MTTRKRSRIPPLLLAAATSLSIVPGVAMAAKTTVHAPKTELTDAQILGVVMAADATLADQGRLAHQRGSADAVDDFGLVMLSDHSEGKLKTMEAANALGVGLEPSLMSQSLRQEGDELITQLETMNARDFDQTYMQEQIMLLERVLNTAEKLSVHANSSKVKSRLKEVKAHAEDHLAIAHAILNELPAQKQ